MIDKLSAPAPARLLVVDDDPSVCHALASVLESEGYAVTVAFDGAAASREFLGRNFDLVLLDLNMPRRDGWATLERLGDIHPLLPVIIITARPDQERVACERGAAGFMEKPLDLESLLRLIARLLAEDQETRLRRAQRRARGGTNERSCQPKPWAASISWDTASGGAFTRGNPPGASSRLRVVGE